MTHDFGSLSDYDIKNLSDEDLDARIAAEEEKSQPQPSAQQPQTQPSETSDLLSRLSDADLDTYIAGEEALAGGRRMTGREFNAYRNAKKRVDFAAQGIDPDEGMKAERAGRERLIETRQAQENLMREQAQYVLDNTKDDNSQDGVMHRRAQKYLDTLNSVDTTRFDDATLDRSMAEVAGMHKAVADRRGHASVFADALKRGYTGTAIMSAQAYLGMTGGDDPENVAAMRHLQSVGEEWDAANPKKVGGVSEIGGTGDVVDFIAESIGENAYRMAIGTTAAIASGGAAGLAGAGATGATAAAMGGSSLSTLALNTGEAVQDQIDEGSPFSRGWALAQGVGYSVLDGAFGVEAGLGKLAVRTGLRTAKSTAVEGLKEVGRMATRKGALTTFLKGIAGEAIQEPAQSQLIGRGRRWAQTGSPLRKGETPAQAWMEALDEAAGGAAAALGVGGGGTVISHANARRIVGIHNRVVEAVKKDAAFAELSPENQLLVARRLMNDSLLETDGVINGETRKDLVEMNKAIDVELGRDDADANTRVANAILRGYDLTFAKEDFDTTVENAKAEGLKSRIDWAAMRDSATKATVNVGGVQERGTLYMDPVTNLQIFRREDENGHIKDFVVVNDSGLKDSLTGDALHTKSLEKALAACGDLDVYNQYRAKKSEGKRQVIADMFNRMYGNRGAQLVIADSLASIKDPAAREKFARYNGKAAYDAASNRVYVLADQINNVGQLFTDLAHERAHLDIAEHILGKSGGAENGSERRQLGEGRERLFGGERGGAESGEERLVEAASVEDILRAVRDTNLSLPGSILEGIRRRIAGDTGFALQSISDEDARTELRFLVEHGYLGKEAQARLDAEHDTDADAIVERFTADFYGYKRNEKERRDAERAAMEEQARGKGDRKAAGEEAARVIAEDGRGESVPPITAAQEERLNRGADMEAALDEGNDTANAAAKITVSPAPLESEEDVEVPETASPSLNEQMKRRLENEKQTANGRRVQKEIDNFFYAMKNYQNVLGNEAFNAENAELLASVEEAIRRNNPQTVKEALAKLQKKVRAFAKRKNTTPTQEATDETGNVRNEAPAESEEGSDGKPQAAEVAKPDEAESPRAEAADAGVVEPFAQPAEKGAASVPKTAEAQTPAEPAKPVEAASRASGTKGANLDRPQAYLDWLKGGGMTDTDKNFSDWQKRQEKSAPKKKSARGANLRGFSYEDYGEETGDIVGAALLRYAKERGGLLQIPDKNSPDPMADWIAKFQNGNARKNRRGDYIALFGMTPRHGGNDAMTEDMPPELKAVVDGMIDNGGPEAVADWFLDVRRKYAEFAARKRDRRRQERGMPEGVSLDEIEARDEADAEYDNAFAEVERYDAGTPTIQNFSRSQMRGLKRGDVLRFDHADTSWDVVEYDADADVVTLVPQGALDNPLMDAGEVAAEMVKYRVSENGFEEVKDGRKDERGATENLAGDAQGAAVREEAGESGPEGFALESVSAEEIRAEKRKRRERDEIKRRLDAPLKGGKGEIGQTLMDLGGAEGEDLFSRTERTEEEKSAESAAQTEELPAGIERRGSGYAVRGKAYGSLDAAKKALEKESRTFRQGDTVSFEATRDNGEKVRVRGKVQLSPNGDISVRITGKDPKNPYATKTRDIPIPKDKLGKLTKLIDAGDWRMKMAGERGAANLGITNLDDARAMEKDGASREDIWRKTGWWRGRDGLWRVEIPDAAFPEWKIKWLKENSRIYGGDVSLGALATAPELFKAYPELKDAKVGVRRLPSGVYAETDPAGRHIAISDALLRKSASSVASTLNHEIQHLVQHAEGMSGGANELKIGFDRYRRKSGEVEARNVQKRMAMTPEERAATPPWETEDVPWADQIVRMGDGGTAALAVRRAEYDRWNRVLDAYERGEMKQNSHATVFEHTPAVLRRLGAPDLPVNLSKDIIDKITGIVKTQMDEEHKVPVSELRNLQIELDNPIAVFDSRSRQDAMVVLTRIVDNQNKERAVVALHLDKVRGAIHVNDIASMYGKDKQSIENWTAWGPLRYVNKQARKSSAKWFQLPSDSELRTRSVLTEKDFSGEELGRIVPQPPAESQGGSKVTSAEDAAYMDAVKRGDMETAQRMVREAAARAMPDTKVIDEDGLPLVVYHDTNSKRYVNRETGEDWDLLTPEQREAWDGRDDWDDYWEEQDFYIFDRRNSRTTNEMPAHFFTPKADPYHEFGERRIAVFLNIKNPSVNPEIEGRGEIDNAGSIQMAKLRNEGYDGFIREYDGKIEEINAFDSNQIKSADPVTYDDAGNVIPLSQRFTPQNEDIRFKRSASDLQRDYDEVVRRYTNADGTKKRGWMRAPNGQPTKLTERQWVQVRTPAFKEWFGDWEANAEIDAQKRRIIEWASDANAISWAKGKALKDCEAKFGGELETIAYIPEPFVSHFDGRASDNRVYTSKGYFIDHIANHGHDDIGVTEYAVLQEMFNEPDEVIKDTRLKPNGEKRNSLLFVKRFAKNRLAAVELSAKEGHIVLHKSLYNTKGRVYPGLPRVDLSGGGRSPISRAADATPGGSLSARDGNIKSNFLRPVKGASRVVDENGEPMVVYHGTNKYGFTVFDRNKVAPEDVAHHFGTEKAADEIIGARQRRGEKSAAFGKYKTFLNIRNPFRCDDVFGNSAEGITEYAVEELRKRGLNEEADALLREQDRNPLASAMEKDADITDETFAEHDKWRSAFRDSIVDAFKKCGYDGIVYRNDSEDKGSDSFIAFDANQVKSATDNTGAFDSANNDIRFKRTAEASDTDYYFGAKESFAAHGRETYTAKDLGISTTDKAVLAAAHRYARDFRRVKQLMDDAILGRERTYTPVDVAALTVKHRDLQHDLADVLRRMESTGNPDEFQAEKELIEAQLDNVARASSIIGTKTGQTLRAFRIGISDDIRDSEAYILQSMRVNKQRKGLGSELTDAELAKAKQMAEQLKAENEKLKAQIAELEANRKKNLKTQVDATDRPKRTAARKAAKTPSTEQRRKDFAKKYGHSVSDSGAKAWNLLAQLSGKTTAMFKGGKGEALTPDMKYAFAQIVEDMGGDYEAAALAIKDNLPDMAGAFAQFRSSVEKRDKSDVSTLADNFRKVVVPKHGLAELAQPITDQRLVTTKDLEGAREECSRQLDENEGNPREQRIALGHYLRRYRDALINENPDIPMDELNEKMAAEATALTGTEHDATAMLAVAAGVDGYDLETRAEIQRKIAKAQRALDLFRAGKINEAARESGLLYEDEATALAEMEATLQKLMQEKADEIDYLGTFSEKNKEAVERVKQLKEEIKEMNGVLHLMRKEAGIAEKKAKYAEVLEKRLAEAQRSADSLQGEIESDEFKERKAKAEAKVAELRAALAVAKRDEYALKKIKDRIAELEKRIADGDYDRQLLQVRANDAELQAKIRMQRERRNALRRRLDEERRRMSYREKGIVGKTLYGMGAILGEMKSVVASFDLSSVLRQGGQLTWAHPFIAAKNLQETLKSWKSEEYAEKLMTQLRQRPNWRYYEKAGIDFTDWGENAANKEDVYLLNQYRKITNSRLLKKGVMASERAFSMFLNLMRADVFDAMAAGSTFGSAANMTDSQLKAMGRFINIASQRGAFEKGGKVANAIPFLNMFLWSPRNVASRFQFLGESARLLTGGAAYGDKTMRRLFAKELVRYIGGMSAAAMFLKAMAELFRDDDDPPNEMEFDPRSSDFLKVRFGNIRIDMTSGLTPIMVFASRMLSGETKNLRGQVRESNRYELVGRFLRQKFAPGASLVYDMGIAREDFERRDIDWTSLWEKDAEHISAYRYFVGSFVPLTGADLLEQAQVGGIPKTFATGFLTALGANVQAFDPYNYKQLKGDYTYFRGLYDKATDPDEKRHLLEYHPMLKRRLRIEAELKSVRYLDRILKNAEKNGQSRPDLEERVKAAKQRAVDAMAGF